MDISAEKEDIKIRQICELKLAKYKSVSDTLKMVISVEETCLVFSVLLRPDQCQFEIVSSCGKHQLARNQIHSKYIALQRHVDTLNQTLYKCVNLIFAILMLLCCYACNFSDIKIRMDSSGRILSRIQTTSELWNKYFENVQSIKLVSS